MTPKQKFQHSTDIREILSMINDDLFDSLSPVAVLNELNNRLIILNNCIDRTPKEEKLYQLLLDYFGEL